MLHFIIQHRWIELYRVLRVLSCALLSSCNNSRHCSGLIYERNNHFMKVFVGGWVNALAALVVTPHFSMLNVVND